MNHRYKVIVSGLAGLTIIGYLVYTFGLVGTLDHRLLKTRHIELLGEYLPSDGGSRVFLFGIGIGQQAAIEVHNRDSRFGGDPEFQEIWLCRNLGFKSYLRLEPGSELERKVIGLVRTASCSRSKPTYAARAPQSEMLKWIIDRISDRKSGWDKATAP